MQEEGSGANACPVGSRWDGSVSPGKALLRWPERGHRMDLPTRRSPVMWTAWVGILRFVTVLFVEHHPADNGDFVAH